MIPTMYSSGKGKIVKTIKMVKRSLVVWDWERKREYRRRNE